MENYELCEKLVEKTGVSFSDAKSALERSDWDLLDAVILLEKEEKTAPSTGNYESEASQGSNEHDDYSCRESDCCNKDKSKKCGEKKAHKKIFSSCVDFLSNNRVVAYNNLGKQAFDIPIWIAALAFIIASWVCIVLILISFGDGWQYKFVGPNLGKDSVNNAASKVSNAFYKAGKDKESNTVEAEFTEKKDEDEK